MVQRSTRSSWRLLPQARLLSHADKHDLLACGVDPASLAYLVPKLHHINLLIKEVKLYAANILKQSMLSIGGDVAVHRHVVSGKVEMSDCLVMGDLRHFKLLIDKLMLQPGLESLAECIQAQILPDNNHLRLNLGGNIFEWKELPVIMGILNITPDSFSDGGRYLDKDMALEHALQMIKEGAQIIDVGGESSRPGSKGIDAKDEISRIIPIIQTLSSSVDVPISVDTYKASVAEASLDAGASIINDITALNGDTEMLNLVQKRGCGLILMHMRGTPEDMQHNTSYHDIIGEIYAFLDKKIEECLDAGISGSSLIIDPGLGFGKDLQGNLSIVRHCAEFKSLDTPVLIGHSRKTFIGKILDSNVDEREEGTDAITALATMAGIDIVRVHNCLHAKRVRSITRSVMEAK